MKLVPGPRPTSCITCQRRKKKCDKTRPACNRCSELGQQCLGYGRKNAGSSHTSPRTSNGSPCSLDSDNIHLFEADVPILQDVYMDGGQSSLSGSESVEPQSPKSPPPLPKLAFDQSYLAIIEPFDSPSDYSATTRQYVNDTKIAESLSLSPDSCCTFEDDDAISCPTIAVQTSTALIQQYRPPDSATFDVLSGHSLAPVVVADSRVSGKTIWVIMSQFEQLFQLLFFCPIKIPWETFRERFATRLLSSDIIHWTTYIAAQMLRSLRKDGEHSKMQRFVPWLDRLDQLCLKSENVSLGYWNQRISAALQLVYLRYITSDVKSGYTLLRSMAPVCMHVACADPTLWPRDPHSNGISLAHALLAPGHEISRFVFMDNMSSLTFGVPLLIEYDPSHPPMDDERVLPIYACPSQLLFLITRVNQWRSSCAKGDVKEDGDWKTIEQEAWAWRPVCVYDPDIESETHVVRLAVQEGWRHALLIYLYMAMCGVTSHDSRVQSSVRQISRLLDLAKSHFSTGMHLIAPLLLAAICTRSEADRAKFLSIVSRSEGNKVPLMQSMKFASVLDHLWHGAAANGAPVTWDDYITSRKAIIDVGV